MSTYRLHCFAQSGNAYKVALYLNCAGLDWEPVFVDFMAGGQTRDPGWREANNPMGEAPVLEVDGKKLTQSGAILTYLAEATGTFAPETADEKYETLRWLLFDNHKFTSYFATHRFMRSFMPNEPSADVLAFLKARADAALGIVDAHLTNSTFMVADRATIADFSMCGYMFYGREETGFDLETHCPNIYAWTERMRALEGWKDPYDLMPGDRIPPMR